MRRYSLAGVCCALLLAACSEKPSSGPDTSSITFKQYYLQGQSLYNTHCSNCHQKTGIGLRRVYPPLNKSDYMESNFEAVICLMKYGKESELIVNGVSYVQPMPEKPSLTALDIAEIATYIYNTWDHKRGLIDVKEVSVVLDKCK